VTGALAMIDMCGPLLLGYLDMPIIRFGTKTRIAVDARAIGDWLGSFGGMPDQIVVEHQQPMMRGEGLNVGATSGFVLGIMFGGIISVLSGLGVPLSFTTPKQWKTKCDLIARDKRIVLDRARGIFGVEPAFAHGRGFGDQGAAIARADAALVGYFGLSERVTGPRTAPPTELAVG
jgi:hypothetical protein